MLALLRGRVRKHGIGRRAASAGAEDVRKAEWGSAVGGCGRRAARASRIGLKGEQPWADVEGRQRAWRGTAADGAGEREEGRGGGVCGVSGCRRPAHAERQEAGSGATREVHIAAS